MAPPHAGAPSRFAILILPHAQEFKQRILTSPLVGGMACAVPSPNLALQSQPGRRRSPPPLPLPLEESVIAVARANTDTRCAFILEGPSCNHGAGTFCCICSLDARAGGFKHIHLYMHEIFTGPNATLFSVVPPLHRGDNARFGMVGVLDDELRDGPDPRNSSLIGRFQSLFAFAGLVTPPGMQTATSLVFTAGEHAGSTLVMVGSIVSSEGPYVRDRGGGRHRRVQDGARVLRSEGCVEPDA
ncbi:hypothetical protein TRIUR3_20714 [Triticum urartu]|uniref:Dirigent protein n=2 Tax=Triticum urartu TaxID=4572 RepID=M8A2Y0_TRIUA|nr:hypothetical protein TRIUR3_20714 [Triticum urartu]